MMPCIITRISYVHDIVPVIPAQILVLQKHFERVLFVALLRKGIGARHSINERFLCCVRILFLKEIE